MADEVKELSDTDILKNILNIGNRRERRIYYRPDGSPTGELPADAYSQLYYMQKGFTLVPPGKKAKAEETVPEGFVKCPFCDFKTEKGANSLRMHLYKCAGNSENKEETK